MQRLETKNSKIGVLGLGYVGLPLALEFAKHHPVVGYDIDRSGNTGTAEPECTGR